MYIYQPQIAVKIKEGDVLKFGPSRLNVGFKGLMCSVITKKHIDDLKKIYGNVSFIAQDILNFFVQEVKLEDFDYISTFIPFFIKPEPLHNDYSFVVSADESDDELIEAFLEKTKKLIRDYKTWEN